jgi:hypothetical protein
VAEIEAELAVDLLGASPARRAAALAVSALAALASGRCRDAHNHARRAGAILDDMGALEEGEALVDRACAEVHVALGDWDSAKDVLAAGVARLHLRAGALPAAISVGFLAMPTNVALLELAARWVSS